MKIPLSYFCHLHSLCDHDGDHDDQFHFHDDHDGDYDDQFHLPLSNVVSYLNYK